MRSVPRTVRHSPLNPCYFKSACFYLWDTQRTFWSGYSAYAFLSETKLRQSLIHAKRANDICTCCEPKIDKEADLEVIRCM
jgi:hypothetical protein